MQEQAISLVRNLAYGDPDCIDYVFAHGDLLLQAVEQQLSVSLRPEISMQVRSRRVRMLLCITGISNWNVWVLPKHLLIIYGLGKMWCSVGSYLEFFSLMLAEAGD